MRETISQLITDDTGFFRLYSYILAKTSYFCDIIMNLYAVIEQNNY